MQTIYVNTHFPKQRSVALTVAVGLMLALVYVLSDVTEASGATVSASGGSCTQTVGSSAGVTVAVVNGKCVITFPTAGTTTWTVPTGVSSVRTLVVGGGGGAGGGGCNWMYGRGGGGGAVVDTAATAVTAGASVNIIVGAGGSASANTHTCSGPPGVTTLGGTGGTSQFATLSPVLGGSSSPTLTSAGGTSGNNNLGSGSAGAGDTMNSWSGGGGGGAGGPGTQSGSGSNWQCGGLLLGNGGPGLFSDITGTSIGHGGGGAGAGCSGNGSATSGGEYYLSGYFRSVGSYGGGGINTTGGAGVVIISYTPIVSAGAPTIGLATATGGTTATVAFTAPASDGGATITSYTATSSPAGGTGTLTQAGSGTISVTGLTTGVAYTFTVTATNSAGTSVASAASNSVTNSYVSTITVPEATYVSASATTNITGLSVGGLAAGSTYQVALSLSPIPTGATLKLPTTTGLTANLGFTSGSNTFTSFTTITFSGLLANVNTALAALQYVSGATAGSPIVQVTVSSLDTNYALNGYNGHFYLSNTTLGLANATYTNARATAKLQSYRGLTGYLTTITSTGENTFISNNIANASNIIFGATDELVEGVWKWDTSGGSPEAGTQFWQGAANGYAVGGQYSAWSSGVEPNDAGGEDYPVTNWGGSLGVWNDCNNTICGAGTAKYVIEFGTSATDGGFVNSSSNLASSTFSLFYATSGQLPSVLVVDPQLSSRYLPTTLNTVGPTNLLLCLNESDISGNNLASPTINFDVAANGGAATTAGSGTSTISGDRTTATYIYGVTANVLTTLNSVLGTQIYLSSGTFSATKYVRIRAISIASSGSIGSKTCASTVYTSQNIEIRPLALDKIMKKGTINFRN